jgi:hypothetical protein
MCFLAQPAKKAAIVRQGDATIISGTPFHPIYTYVQMLPWEGCPYN